MCNGNDDFLIVFSWCNLFVFTLPLLEKNLLTHYTTHSIFVGSGRGIPPGPRTSAWRKTTQEFENRFLFRQKRLTFSCLVIFFEKE